jgi:DNA-binding beta-propeller fold protein YncE
VNKVLPDYLRPRVYALNQANGSVPGTLLALNDTNGTILGEIPVNLNPTDMVMTPTGDAIYVINAGSRTISKVDLNSFAVTAEKSISTPNTYNTANPLHLAVGRSNLVYFTDGGWAPSVTTFDYASGTTLAVYDDGNGAGGINVTRNGNILYRWRQYGWGAGNVNSWVTRYDALTNANLTPLEDSFISWRRDPTDTPIFMDAAERWVFNKQQMFAATNVSVLLNQFSDNIYGISLDGSIAFGPTEVFNTQTGATITNLPFSTTIQTLSGDQKMLFRYNASITSMVVYDMAGIASVSGPDIVPTPGNGSVVSLPLTALTWTASPQALSYDIYFGTDRTAVAGATQGSAQYLGRITSPAQAASQSLLPGATYYWRVDVVGFNATNTGSVWSFTAAAISVNPPQLNLGAMAGFNPAAMTLSLTSAAPVAWTAAVTGGSEITLNPMSGTSPSTVTVAFNTLGVGAGQYTNNIEITASGVKLEVPVIINIQPLNIVKMAADYQRPYIYALQPPAFSGQNGQLLFINTTTGNIDKVLPTGLNPVDLSVSYGEGRLYIASAGEDAVYVVDLNTQTVLPPLILSTADIYKVNAGKPGQLITEGLDQWIYAYLVNTTNGSTLVTAFYREGDGQFDPTGRYYYHSDDNISSAAITKFDMSADTFASVVAAGGAYYYGSRNIVMSADGTRIFWTGMIYDANLNSLGNLGEEIYATTAHGDLAFGGQHVFNVNNGQSIYTLPFSTSIIAVSGDQQKVFLFNSTTKQLTVISMSSIAAVPGPGLNPTPADASVVNPPLRVVSWTPSPLALTYRVFLGTNPASVASADTNSTLYLGTTSSNAFTLPGSLSPGTTYYWRVDSVGFSTSTIIPGSVWSFTISAMTVSPQSLAISGVAGLPVLPQGISLSATAPSSWTLSVAQPWITAFPASGTTPSSIVLSFNTTSLAAGSYTNQLTLTANGITLQFPVVLQLFNLNASKMVADPNRNYVYVLHPGSGSFADAFLLFLNTDTGVVEKVIPIGTNPTDMTVNRFEDRLYVSNGAHDETRVVDLVSRTELAPLYLGLDIYKLNAGKAGRLITEGMDQWIAVNIVNTLSGTVVGAMPYPEREGDGEMDPTGTVYYHCDNNISNAHIHKFQLVNDTVTETADSPEHPYGSRNLVLSPDGTRLFWRGYVYDANLTELGVIGAEIYASSTNGAVAFGSNQAFDTASKQVIYNLPASSAVSVVDRQNRRFWYFNTTTAKIGSIPMTAIQSPSITQQPAASTTVGVGGNVYLSVTAMGFGTLSYQWTLGGTNVPGQTNYFLSFNGVQPWQAGDYHVVVANAYGSVTGSVARLTVVVPPSITSQPQSTNLFAGQTISLFVAATGSAPLSYQWTFESVNILGATNPVLAIANAQAVNEGIYRVVVQNVAGAATSAVARVRVLPAAPQIVSGPTSATVPASTNVIFGVQITGSQPLSYQWLFNGSPIGGANASQFTLSDVQSWHAGNYQVIVANGMGSATSAIATLAVTPLKPYFVTQPFGATLPAGTNYTLTGLAQGSEPIAYQWRRDGQDLPLASQPALTIANLKGSDAGGYILVAFNVVGVSTSLVANVVVTAAPPVFVQQPASVTLLAGSSTTFNSLAAGSAPLQYQWYHNSSPLLNQTNRQFTIALVTTHSGGPYFVVAANSFGSVTSAVAQLTVNQPAAVIFGLTNQVVDRGNTVTLSMTATGTDTLTYNWQFNGAAIPGSTPTLTITNIQSGQSGYYRVSVANTYGSASSTGRVSVLGPVSWVVAWGDDSGGQTDVPPNLGDSVSVAGGDFHTLALSRNGILTAWGYNGDGQTTVPSNALRFISIASGAGHNLAITENGSVVAWGRNDSGQCNVPSAAMSVLTVAAGDSHSLALLSSGTIVAWGDNSFGQVSGAANLTGIRAIAAGRLHNLALRNNGTVAGWGYNGYGQATSPQGLSGVAAIAAGYLHSVALCSNGTVVAWGDNTFGQLSVPPGLSNIVAIAAGDFHTLALRSDGLVLGWGDDSFGQTEVPAFLRRTVALGSGYYHGLALMPPILRYARNPAEFVIQWDGPGILQWAPTPAGPFVDVAAASRIYTNTYTGASSKFFRLRR